MHTRVLILNMLAQPGKIQFCRVTRQEQLHSLRTSTPGVLVRFSISMFISEELSIALAPNLSKDSRRGICRGGNEFEILPACRPTNGSAILDDMGIELVLRIVEMESILHAAPANVK